jgi:hypothetical protein
MDGFGAPLMRWVISSADAWFASQKMLQIIAGHTQLSTSKYY